MPKRKYTDDDLQKAVTEVKNRRLSCDKAAKLFSIPKSTIHDHVKGKYSSTKPGPAGMMLPEEEDSLVFYIKYVAERGFPITRKMLKTLVLGIVKESGRKMWCNDKLGPSDEWCRKFLQRHPELSERAPEPQDKARARMSNMTVLNQYFGLLENTTKELGIDKASQIFNCDESGFSGKEKSTEKVYVLKGAHAHQQRNLTNSHVTVHMCISGEGRVLPSFIIFQGSLPHRNFTDGVPSEWLFGSSESGYMDHDLFLKWFEGIFLSNCGVRRPVLLVMDNHDSHITLPFLKLAIANNITILGLPPHTTHLLQPLDVGVFGPLKAKVTSLASKLSYVNANAVVGKAKFPALLSTAIDQTCTPALIKSSFAKSGLFPVDIEAIDKTQIQPPSVDNHAKDAGKKSSDDDTENEADIQHILCHECGTKLEIEAKQPENPLVKMGLIPETLANILVPPPNIAPKKVKSAKIVTEARILTGQDVIRQLEEKEENARRQEEEKENRKVERIRKREEKERQAEERRLNAEEKKKEREKKKTEIEREKQRKREVRERKKCRKDNGLQDKCTICKQLDPDNEGSESDINWVQCGICDGWVHEVCSGVRVRENEEYMCEDCLKMFEE